jgi:folate-dependent tRNA-U54 methylase TrmFO/GidA
MENAEFLQFGQIHRNTFINSPKILDATLQTKKNPRLFFAGQITGVEGYVESVGTGWLAGLKRGANFTKRRINYRAADFGNRRVMPLCFQRRDEKFSARQYHVRLARRIAA